MAGASSSSSYVRASSAPTPSSRPPSSGVLRIQHELHTFSRDPVPFIYVSADETDVTKITALVIGPLETPYAGGFFHFDMRVGSDYPMNPPKVVLQTTDGGRVRFNPNLYADGKVCLSILGTWTGPSWSSAESLSSVLLSIQSLMCPEPYHNEPGYETRGTAATKTAYNDYIRYETLRVSVLQTFNHANYMKKFPDVCDRLFLLWYEMYVNMATDLRDRLEGKSYKDSFSSRRGVYNLKPILEGLLARKKKIMERMETIDTPILDPVAGLTEAAKSSITYAIDRLQDENRLLQQQPPPGGSASPRNPSSPFVWDATILGPENSPWEGGLFSLELRFSCQHPYRPPFAKFTSKMFHPNITEDGIPALDIIQTRWNPNTRIGTILDQLQEMLRMPGSEYPVRPDIAVLQRTNKREYERSVRRLAQEGI